MPKASTYRISEKYKGVYQFKNLGVYTRWCAIGTVNGRKFNIPSDSERDAALKYDKKMIEIGKEPVNILKRK